MAGPSKIEWCTDTWNPIVGCSIVSPGCTNCYAMRMAARIIAMANGQDHDVAAHYDRTLKNVKGKPVWSGVIKQAPEHILLQPLKWKKPRRIFVNSMGDLFHESIPDEWIDRVFAVMALCPQHTFQVLTKRAERMREYIRQISQRKEPLTKFAVEALDWACCGGRRKTGQVPASAITNLIGNSNWPLPNVWLGVSAERQQEWDERKDHLKNTPAAVHFASFEPLLGGIVEPLPMSDYLQWAIVGGESGKNARPMHPDWAMSLQRQCETAGVEFFFKQWGEFAPSDDLPVEMVWNREQATVLLDGRIREWQQGFPETRLTDSKMRGMTRVGKKAAGRLLDGREWNQMPQLAHNKQRSEHAGASV